MQRTTPLRVFPRKSARPPRAHLIILLSCIGSQNRGIAEHLSRETVIASRTLVTPNTCHAEHLSRLTLPIHLFGSCFADTLVRVALCRYTCSGHALPIHLFGSRFADTLVRLYCDSLRAFN